MNTKKYTLFVLLAMTAGMSQSCGWLFGGLGGDYVVDDVDVDYPSTGGGSSAGGTGGGGGGGSSAGGTGGGGSGGGSTGVVVDVPDEDYIEGSANGYEAGLYAGALGADYDDLSNQHNGSTYYNGYANYYSTGYLNGAEYGQGLSNGYETGHVNGTDGSPYDNSSNQNDGSFYFGGYINGYGFGYSNGESGEYFGGDEDRIDYAQGIFNGYSYGYENGYEGRDYYNGSDQYNGSPYFGGYLNGYGKGYWNGDSQYFLDISGDTAKTKNGRRKPSARTKAPRLVKITVTGAISAELEHVLSAEMQAELQARLDMMIKKGESAAVIKATLEETIRSAIMNFGSPQAEVSREEGVFGTMDMLSEMAQTKTVEIPMKAKRGQFVPMGSHITEEQKAQRRESILRVRVKISEKRKQKLAGIACGSVGSLIERSLAALPGSKSLVDLYRDELKDQLCSKEDIKTAEALPALTAEEAVAALSKLTAATSKDSAEELSTTALASSRSLEKRIPLKAKDVDTKVSTDAVHL